MINAGKNSMAVVQAQSVETVRVRTGLREPGAVCAVDWPPSLLAVGPAALWWRNEGEPATGRTKMAIGITYTRGWF